MPKVLVQFDASSKDAAQAARTVAEGAESVRFTEVEVRALDARERLADYDGVVLVASRAGMDAATEALAGLTDKVGAVVAPDGADAQSPLVAAMLRAGMIVVGAGPEGEARAVGARVAKVTEWVRHARSHHHHHTH